jgi:gas vesicle protein
MIKEVKIDGNVWELEKHSTPNRLTYLKSIDDQIQKEIKRLKQDSCTRCEELKKETEDLKKFVEDFKKISKWYDKYFG